MPMGFACPNHCTEDSDGLFSVSECEDEELTIEDEGLTKHMISGLYAINIVIGIWLIFTLVAFILAAFAARAEQKAAETGKTGVVELAAAEQGKPPVPVAVEPVIVQPEAA